MRNLSLRPIASLVMALLPILVCVSLALAVEHGKITETEYSTGLSEVTGIVRIIVALFGGFVAVLGIVVALRNIGGTAGVELSLSDQKRMVFKNISQGVVIILIGATMLVAAVYLLPDKKKVRLIEGEKITIDPQRGTMAR